MSGGGEKVENNLEQDSEYEVIHLDVGNANSSIIKYNGRNILIDGGLGKDVDVIKSELKRVAGESPTLDVVVGTHYDRDHQQGIKELLLDDDIDAKQVYGPDLGLYSDEIFYEDTFLSTANKQGCNTRQISGKERITGPGLELDIRFPSEGYEGVEVSEDKILGTANKNDGLVVKSTYKGEHEHSTLFLGDATPAELDALDEEFVHADSVVLSHHGSKKNLDITSNDISDDTLERLGFAAGASPSLPEIERAIQTREDLKATASGFESAFLENVNPQDAIVSAHPDAYKRGEYSGHPDESTLAAVEGSDIETDLHYTQVHGTIRQTVGPDGVETHHDYRPPEEATDILDARLREEELDFQQGVSETKIITSPEISADSTADVLALKHHSQANDVDLKELASLKEGSISAEDLPRDTPELAFKSKYLDTPEKTHRTIRRYPKDIETLTLNRFPKTMSTTYVSVDQHDADGPALDGDAEERSPKADRLAEDLDTTIEACMHDVRAQRQEALQQLANDSRRSIPTPSLQQSRSSTQTATNTQKNKDTDQSKQNDQMGKR